MMILVNQNMWHIVYVIQVLCLTVHIVHISKVRSYSASYCNMFVWTKINLDIRLHVWTVIVRW
jgi:hypothetical protein